MNILLGKHAAFGGLGASNLVAMVVAFATNIVITRWLTDAEFGEYRLVVNLSVAIFGIVNFGIHVTAARKLALEDDALEQREVLGDGMALLTAACIGGAGLAAGGSVLAQTAGSDQGRVLGLAAVLLLPIGLQRGLVYLLRGSQRIAHIGMQTVAPPIVVALVWILAPNFGIGQEKLGPVFAVAVYGLSFTLVHLVSVTLLRPVIRGGIKTRWRDYLADNRREGWQVYKGSLVGVVSAEVVSVVVGFTNDLGQYGAYALAWSLASPLTLLPMMMQTLHFRGFAREETIRHGTLWLLAGATAACLALGLVTTSIIKHSLYGDGYPNLLEYLSVLGVAVLLHSLGDYVNSYHIARGRSDRARKAAYRTGLTLVASALVTVPFLGVWGLAISRITASLAFLVLGMSRLDLKR